MNRIFLKKIIPIICILLVAGLRSAGQSPLDTLTYLQQSPNVYSILIEKNDKLQFRKFYNGRNQQDLFNDQSLTKSIMSLLIGIAIDKGFIKSADEKIVDFFPELKKDSDRRKALITVRNIMNQASGLYHEDINGIPAYLQLPNPSGYELEAPLLSEPGKEFHYSNAASHLLSVILTKATGMDTRTFAEKFLFGPMGITRFDWEKMRDGYYDGCGLLSIRLCEDDMLKIGLMVLHKGRYKDKQLVPEKWIAEILEPKIFYPTQWGFKGSIYSLCWYHATYKGKKIIYGLGWGGQFLVVIPALNAVVAISENTSDHTAIMQSDNFVNKLFPVIFDQLNTPSGVYR